MNPHRYSLSIVYLILVILMIFIPLTGTAGASESGRIEPDTYTNTSDSGPDYKINDVSRAKQSTWIEPGMVITQNITINNTGGDDLSSGALLITASFGDYPLIPRNNSFMPMKNNEKSTIMLEYLIPNGIPPREYPLILSLANKHETNESNFKSNDVRTSNLFNVRTITPGVKANNCGCSAG